MAGGAVNETHSMPCELRCDATGLKAVTAIRLIIVTVQQGDTNRGRWNEVLVHPWMNEGGGYFFLPSLGSSLENTVGYGVE